jgi:hypothetical protein
MSTDTVTITAAQFAEYRTLRAKAKRNAAARARRASNPGGGYAEQALRMAAYAPHYARQGTVSLADLSRLVGLYGRTLDEAVVRLVSDEGWSWAMIGQAVGMTRQGAQQRWGRLVKTTRPQGGQVAAQR